MFIDRLQKRSGKDKTGPYEKLRPTVARHRPLHHESGPLSHLGKLGGLVDRVLEHRHEMKYSISESHAAAIERFIQPYLNLDHYCKERPGGAYPIVSLYLDSEDLHLCRESLEGRKNRFKLRIRSYTDDLDYPRFFEIKRRINTIIVKNRAKVMPADVETLLSGISLPPQNFKTDEQLQLIRQFQLYVNSINASPKVRVRYMRRAYEDDSPNRVRVTFDRQLAYNVDSSPSVSLDDGNWQRHWPESVILEIKFTGYYPVWLGQMVECFNLCQQSISKYTSSIKKACLLRFCAPKRVIEF